MIVDSDICGLKVGDNYPVRLMGIINLSQESFYKSSVINADSILNKAYSMIDEGADILDIGARSTWLHAETISKKKEIERLEPALKILDDNIDVLISVDTMFADIAEKSLNLGADIINDVSGFKNDSSMIDVIVQNDCPAIAMATKNIPGDPIGMDAVMDALAKIIEFAESKKMSTEKLILDPAIGKWIDEKDPIYDFETIDNFERLKIFNKPLLAAISRKSCVDAVLNKPVDERLYGTLAATSIAVYNGAHIIRTHDVKETSDIAKMSATLRNKTPVVKNHEIEITIEKITNIEDANRLMQMMKVTTKGSQIMKKKTIAHILRISNISTAEALIIKQEMLARGGDAALEKSAVSHDIEKTDILLIGTTLQLENLVKKMVHQTLNLPKISTLIKNILKQKNDIEYI